ncbi:MAG: LON peptidase substrate-binding domain-containing protein [Oleiphilaceae bacterium]|nr:LON peptidase substrate-binding domain-containing protein [Oleiphilaceae bacterium]
MRRPLFPLGSIVLPGGRLPLQLFERRYLDMLSGVMGPEKGFVVVLMREHRPDNNRDQAFYDLGTLVEVVDFAQRDNGLLGITVEGRCKVRIERHWQEKDGLNWGDIVALEEEPAVTTPAHYLELENVLRALVQHPAVASLSMEIDYRDARQLGWRLTELLPLELAQRQRLMACEDPLQRLEQIQHWMESIS